jgi:RNA polymerase sigma-70 factor, ECF subfamily
MQPAISHPKILRNYRPGEYISWVGALRAVGMEPVASPSNAGLDPVQLIMDHQVSVWRYLRALGCTVEQAEDFTQETFLAVLEKPFQQYSPHATRAYLRKVAYNLFVTAQRRSGRVVVVEDVEQYDKDWSRWAGHDDGEALLDALRDCFEQLTERAKLALRKRFHDKSSRTDIATALAMTEHGAKNLMQRAKKRLRDCVEGKLGDSQS